MSQKPFSSLPDPAFLYKSPEHEEALTKLEHTMRFEAGITLLCGDTGCGKTTLIRYLINHLDESVHLGLVSLMRPSSDHLLPWILYAFGLDYKISSEIAQYDALLNSLVDNYNAGKRSVLVVDEAHELGDNALEEIRMLSNLNVDEQPLISIILAGHVRLAERLRSSDLAMLQQRIGYSLYLGPLSREQCGRYIDHRMRVSGGVGAVFSPDAVNRIHQGSHGVPRLINSICETALIHACSRSEESVDASIIDAIIEGRQQALAAAPRPINERTPRPGYVDDDTEVAKPPHVHSVIKRSVTPFGVGATAPDRESPITGGSANDAHHRQINPRAETSYHGASPDIDSDVEADDDNTPAADHRVDVAREDSGTVKPFYGATSPLKSQSAPDPLRVQIKLLLAQSPGEDDGTASAPVVDVITQLKDRGFDILNHKTHIDRDRGHFIVKVLTNWFDDAAKIATVIGTVSGVKTVLDIRFPPPESEPPVANHGAVRTDLAEERAARAKRRARAASFFGPEPF